MKLMYLDLSTYNKKLSDFEILIIIFALFISLCLRNKYEIYDILCLLSKYFLIRLNATECHGCASRREKCNKENGLFDKISLVNVRLCSSATSYH